MLVPTKTRFPISRELAYPIGAEALSEALAGVPQFDQLSLSFWTGMDATPASFHRRSESGQFLPVLEAAYRNIDPGRTASKSMLEQGWYEETWQLLVYPVLRQHTSLVRRALELRGLTRIREWLEKPRPETWRHGRKICGVRVRPLDGTAEFYEHP
jgi:hypothetical protein